MSVLLHAGGALADGGGSSGDRRASAHKVDFEANQVEVDGELRELQLSGDVVVVVDRYRVTSQRLRLRRTPRGILVDGNGRVALCRCPDPPVTFGFRSATVAPPTDLLIEQPTLRVADVPVLWLPYLWLRSPDRLGLLPPRLEWRGRDGFLAGSGVHLPLGTGPRPSAADVSAAGYAEGGVEVVGSLVTPATATRVRWDHKNGDLLGLEAAGASSPVSTSAVAWRVDAVRGGRARAGLVPLEAAARRYDRADVAAIASAGGSVLGVGAQLTAERGGDLDRLGSVGPGTYFGTGAPLGDAGTAGIELDVRSVDDAELGPLTFVDHRGDVVLHARPGPVVAGMGAHESAQLVASERADGRAAAAGAELALGLPLSRRYGADLTHRVEPFIEGGGGVAEAVAARPGLLVREDGAFYSAAIGGRTSLGRYVTRSAGQVEVRVGWVASGSARADTVAAWRGGASTRWAAFSVEGGALPVARRSVAVGARTRLGSEVRAHLLGYVEGRAGVTPARARLLPRGGWDEPRSIWLDRSGWTTGGELRVPWTRWLATAAALDYDATGHRELATRGSLGYRHPCGCLAVLAWAGRRLGREGFDARLSLDLLP